ncbi:hypothetical protein JQ557_16810 [Bradyrhizobium sp. U87765 SZCCT0131]|uniref:hypothetical protein n=1 Tax=unclassified Bradyrhizobium TaxID=2631580 RepID=UPI001BA70433|nr:MULTISPECIES: hypothetical protein [unclassified Bradyrhizobium]MBR1219670.1 hypothetical protein [Bradyrhizobium sp. U87765 SZCCT0131]MBR1262321.1 hypothetical protein [Bradyrhizobium sp. U87765 SZCCT0134]MBR1308496.1 hypothetical protein [Bradyrhizobium sp. U87765 SZCCT0110]MBR1318103.1 hypothetical protein [Bradyrhizobium sp. U87765 SZCCT0109]MBR1351806.1 hypothetical protein [Bradyrhizobium sp. U87765 SZCCT0048]
MKILLVDTAFAAVPIYDYLMSAGHDVWVMGGRSGDVLAQRAGDRWIEQDYSNVDAVRAHVLRLGFDRVVPGCTDVSIATCLQLEMFSHLLDSPQADQVLSNKLAFRDLCRRLALPAPRVADRAEFPLAGRFICKPVDAFSGRGISIFDGEDLDALRSACETAEGASPRSTFLIETFAEGQLHSCSAFVENHKIVDAFYVIEGSSANPFAVDTSYVVYDLPEAATRTVEGSLEKISADLRLRDGLIHAQFILTPVGPLLVEVCRRCPGDLYSLLIEYSSGFQYAAKYASYFSGNPLDARRTRRSHVLRHTFGTAKPIVFGGLVFDAPVSVRALFPIQPIGQTLPIRQGGGRAGILFCEAATADELETIYATFVSRDAYRLV